MEGVGKFWRAGESRIGDWSKRQWATGNLGGERGGFNVAASLGVEYRRLGPMVAVAQRRSDRAELSGDLRKRGRKFGSVRFGFVGRGKRYSSPPNQHGKRLDELVESRSSHASIQLAPLAGG